MIHLLTVIFFIWNSFLDTMIPPIIRDVLRLPAGYVEAEPEMLENVIGVQGMQIARFATDEDIAREMDTITRAECVRILRDYHGHPQEAIVLENIEGQQIDLQIDFQDGGIQSIYAYEPPNGEITDHDLENELCPPQPGQRQRRSVCGRLCRKLSEAIPRMLRR